ncbi:hypothetical protein ACT3XG_14760 [Paenibacillus polymyxa]|uniref:hypothetical protein n=1 Tax=Paenibacillus TaxID=44249 RepID=UPI00142D6996|nr:MULTISPECIES: hypothetical protein [Paenibacillus]KAF6658885.1 hypothetical protein HFD99_01330 [Paenibacillus sp. EKM301P]UBS85417.1 hypothetical protein LAZ93_14715 [Paenibacillus polymyxa]WHX33936.1 hypothetical protein QNH38_15195 [Paenibacillus polymyxa]
MIIDYKVKFAEDVTELIAEDIADRDARMAAVSALTEDYVMRYGEYPDMIQLERLTDYILREELTNTDRMKARNDEYPFLSERQFERRREREVPLEVAEEYGADGRNYRVPKRRKRSIKELIFVDEHAKIRNKLRAARYRRDTAPSSVTTYNLNETGGELTDEFTQCVGILDRLPEREQFVDADVQIAA